MFWLIMHAGIKRWRKLGKRAFWIASLGWPLTAIPLIYFRRQIFGPPVYVSGPESMLMLLLASMFGSSLVEAMKWRLTVSFSSLK